MAVSGNPIAVNAELNGIANIAKAKARAVRYFMSNLHKIVEQIINDIETYL
jgi:hypothetical protein